MVEGILQILLLWVTTEAYWYAQYRLRQRMQKKNGGTGRT